MKTKVSTDKLRAALKGKVVLPGDVDYDTARAVYNAMIDKRPAAIVQCAEVDDVVRGIQFAREADLVAAIRGGRHNGGGLGTVDGGVVIDLGGLRTIHVDPGARTVRVEGGATWTGGRQGDARARTRGALWGHLDDRRRRTHARRRSRVPHAQVRADDRQSDRRRRRARRRP